MKEASLADQEYVAQCFVNVSLYLKSRASDIYINGLPEAVDENTLALAGAYIKDTDAVVFIAERKASPIACIAARIENTSFSPGGIGTIGNIAMCWVEEAYRNQNIGKALVGRVESWFALREIKVIELSYLAQNALAEKTWNKIGYVPFRIFSHKIIGDG